MGKTIVLEVIRQGQIGGGESHLYDLIYFLDKNRFEPVCLSFTNGNMITQLRKEGIRCYVIESGIPFDIKVQKQIQQIIKDEGIQLVHAHGSRAASNVLYTVKQMHIPFIYTVHGWSFHDDQSLLVRKLRAWSEKLICYYANEVICVSQSNEDTGRDVFGLKSAHVIENGINLERFNPELKFKNLRREFGFSDSDFIVGFIARCTLQKNPISFLEAIKTGHQINPQIKGLFVGEGDLDEEVDKYIDANNMNDYLYRSAFRTDVPDLLNCVDVYCLPSLWEGLSIALLEAMAMGKAIIATPTDGTKELIEDGKNGLIVPFNNADAIVKALNTFYQDRTIMSRCSKEARMFVAKRFNAQRVAESVSKIYSKYESGYKF